MEDLQKVVAALRAPDGCPWDREQTHESLKPCCVEEAAEVVSGINILKETGNADNLKEELGDLLLQVVMHAQIAEEEGLFTMEDVIGGITEKMIRRHPHVFGETDDAGKAADLGRTGSGRENICCAEPGQTDHGQIVNSWAEIKKREKAGKEWMDQYLPKAFAEFRDLIDRAEERKFKRKRSIPILRIASVNIFPVIRGRIRKISTVCSAIAPCMCWETAAAEILFTGRTDARSAPTASFPTDGKIMRRCLPVIRRSWRL